MKYPWKEVWVALLVGVLIGWFASTRSFEGSGHGPRKDRLIEKFSGELSLTPEQKEKVRAVLEAKREQYRTMREELRPKFDAVRVSSREEIEKLLTPEQIPLFRKMEAEWKERKEKYRRHRRP